MVLTLGSLISQGKRITSGEDELNNGAKPGPFTN